MDKIENLPDICQSCSHALECKCCYSEEYSDCKLRKMSIEELINLVIQITGERDYYRNRCERKLKELESHDRIK
jgi:hypothetical protein